MMTFGWNPYPSMFQGPTAKDQTLQAVVAMQQAGVDIPSALEDVAKAQAAGNAQAVTAAPPSPSGSWFYILLGIAAAAGLMHGRCKA